MKKKLCSSKSILLTAFLLFLSALGWGQSNGDFRSRNSGNWSSSNRWQIYYSGTWNDCPYYTGGWNGTLYNYPGEKSGTGTVTILDGDDIRLNVSPAYSIGAILIGGGTSGSLQFERNNSYTLNITGNLTVSSGASLTIRARTNSTPVNNLNVGGNITNNGTFNFTNGTYNSTVRLTGANKSIGGSSASTFYNLILGNGTSTTISLGNSQAVNGTLTLNNVQLLLGSNNLTLGASSPAVSGSFWTGNMIVADGTGEARKLFSANGSYTFPLGDSSDGTANYSPVTLNFTSGTYGSGAYAGVRVTDAKHPSNTSVANYLTRYWTVSQSGISAFSCNVTGNYEYGGDVVGQESLQNAGLYSGSAWTAYNTLGSNTLTATGVTGFGDFTGISIPLISVNNTTLSGFTYVHGAGPSIAQNITVYGVNLSANLLITAPTNYEVSTSSGSGYQQSITLTPSGGIINYVTVYFRLKAGLAVGNYDSETAVLSSTGATTVNVSLSGSVSAANFYSRANGNWNSNTTWSHYSGGSAVPTGVYPQAGDVVFIERGYTVTVSADAECESITFTNVTTATNTLSISSGVTLTTSEITIPRAGGTGTTYVNRIAVGSGTLVASNIAFTNGGTSVRHQITISTGTVTVSGNVTTDIADISANITFTGAGLFQAGGYFLNGGTTGGSLTPGTGTVEYNGSAQAIRAFTYNHLVLSGSGAKTVTGVTVNGNLSVSGSASLTPAATFAVAGTTTLSGTSLLTLGTSNILSSTPVNLDGGTFRTGATTGYNETVGTLKLSANSTLALGTGNHTLTFANSSGIGWTTGQTLTITGWTGTLGSSGTAGKLFIGNNTTGLTSSQLAQIQFSIGGSDYPATILSNGEVVPACSSLAITCPANVSVSTGPSTNGLQTYYPFNETSGTTASDEAGSNDATLTNGPTWADGQLGNAVNIDGDDDYVDLPDGIANYTNLTISAWVYLADNDQWSRIFDFGTSTTNYMFLTPYGGTNVIRFAIRNDYTGEQIINGTAALPTGSWQHVAVTLSGSSNPYTGRLYVNGTEVGSNTAMTLTPASLGNTTANFIGESQYAADPVLNGQVDEFRIYNRALTANEIKNLSNNSSCSVYVDLGTPTSLGGCGTVTYSNNASFPMAPGTHTVTWTGNDGSSTATCQQTVTVSDNSTPVITSQPVAPSTLHQRTSGRLSVVATGSSLTYQWQVNSGSGWTDLSDGSYYEGTNTENLDIYSPVASMNGYQYRVIVQGTSACYATSNTVTIDVSDSPPAMAVVVVDNIVKPVEISVGQTVSITFDLHNIGPDATVDDVTWSFQLPANLEYVATGSTPGITYNSGTRTVSATHSGPMAVGATDPYEISVQLSSDIECPGGQIEEVGNDDCNTVSGKMTITGGQELTSGYLHFQRWNSWGTGGEEDDAAEGSMMNNFKPTDNSPYSSCGTNQGAYAPTLADVDLYYDDNNAGIASVVSYDDPLKFRNRITWSWTGVLVPSQDGLYNFCGEFVDDSWAAWITTDYNPQNGESFDQTTAKIIDEYNGWNGTGAQIGAQVELKCGVPYWFRLIISSRNACSDNAQGGFNSAGFGPAGSSICNASWDDYITQDLSIPISMKFACDSDGDGYDDAEDIDDDNDGIPDLTEGSESDRDTDGDNVLDMYDLDSDNDGIYDLIDAGGTDTDNNGLVDLGTHLWSYWDENQNGLFDLYDIYCNTLTYSGNGTEVMGYSVSVSYPLRCRYASDDLVSRLNQTGDTIILKLNDVIPAGQTITIRHNEVTNTGTTSSFRVEQSLDRSSYSNANTFGTSGTAFTTSTYTVTGSSARYLRFTNLNAGANDAGIDAVSYSFTADLCPTHPGNPIVGDSDADGTLDSYELDADNDGCYDVTEAGFSDDDTNGLLGSGTFGNGLTVNAITGVVSSGSGYTTGSGYSTTNDRDSDNIYDFKEANSPVISAQPANQSVCAGVPVSFSITATNVASYQWQVSSDGGTNWSNLSTNSYYSGVTSATLSISSVPGSFFGNQYRVSLTRANFACNGSFYSESATLSFSGAAGCNIPPVANNDVTYHANTHTETILSPSLVNNDTDSDGSINAATVDLNPSTPGAFDQSYTDIYMNSWVVNASGVLTFTSSSNFCGTASITYTVNDNLGVSSNVATIEVIVDDIVDPTVTSCPANILSVETTLDPAEPVFADNCGVSSVTWSMSGATTDSGNTSIGSYTFGLGVTTITYTATDAAGNQTTCVFTVTTACIDVETKAVTVTDCPSLAAPPFNPDNSNYQPGYTEVEYTVTRHNTASAWQFKLAFTITPAQIEGVDLVMESIVVNDGTSDITPDGSGFYNIGAGVDEVTVSASKKNEPGYALSISLEISSVSSDGCNEAAGDEDDNTATVEISAMPAVGNFN